MFADPLYSYKLTFQQIVDMREWSLKHGAFTIAKARIEGGLFMDLWFDFRTTQFYVSTDEIALLCGKTESEIVAYAAQLKSETDEPWELPVLEGKEGETFFVDFSSPDPIHLNGRLLLPNLFANDLIVEYIDDEESGMLDVIPRFIPYCAEIERELGEIGLYPKE